jgi:hypothetical protein
MTSSKVGRRRRDLQHDRRIAEFGFTQSLVERDPHKDRPDAHMCRRYVQATRLQRRL